MTNLEYWAQAFTELLRQPGGVDVAARLLRYVYLVTENLQYQEFRATIRERIPEAERVTMTMAEELMQQGRLEMLLTLLTLKFGELDDKHRERLASASEGLLLRYLERALTATTIEDVLAESV